MAILEQRMDRLDSRMDRLDIHMDGWSRWSAAGRGNHAFRGQRQGGPTCHADRHQAAKLVADADIVITATATLLSALYAGLHYMQAHGLR